MKRGKNKFKDFWKKFWFIVWKDDSFKGWLISLIFIFIVIKLIFFPLLNLATGTSLPLAIVESCSMHHEGTLFGNFNKWWDRHETKYQSTFTKESFEDSKLKKGFTKGDILFIVRAKPEKLKVGDIIIFNGGERNPIIHRIIKIKQIDGKYIFSTEGDNNNGQLSIEQEISEDQLVGKAAFRIAPYIGWGKLVFFEHIQPDSNKGFCKER